jgi:hypothetical protein
MLHQVASTKILQRELVLVASKFVPRLRQLAIKIVP